MPDIRQRSGIEEKKELIRNESICSDNTITCYRHDK